MTNIVEFPFGKGAKPVATPKSAERPVEELKDQVEQPFDPSAAQSVTFVVNLAEEAKKKDANLFQYGVLMRQSMLDCDREDYPCIELSWYVEPTVQESIARLLHQATTGLLDFFEGYFLGNDVAGDEVSKWVRTISTNLRAVLFTPTNVFTGDRADTHPVGSNPYMLMATISEFGVQLAANSVSGRQLATVALFE